VNHKSDALPIACNIKAVFVIIIEYFEFTSIIVDVVFRTPVNSWFRQPSPTDDSDNDNDKEMMCDITTSDRFASRRS